MSGTVSVGYHGLPDVNCKKPCDRGNAVGQMKILFYDNERDCQGKNGADHNVTLDGRKGS